MKLTIQNKLFAGFGIVVVITTLMSINNIIMIGKLTISEERLTEIRLPTVEAGMELTDGVHLSLAGLRGYLILGKDPLKAKVFKAERQSGIEKIDQAILELDAFSKGWTEPENIKLLNEMKQQIIEFKQAQLEIEEISHQPENIPAIDMLLTQAAPRAAKILQALSVVIDEESVLPANQERKNLLKWLADSRGSFAIGLANIRAYILSGNEQFIEKFHANWRINETRFTQILKKSHLFNSRQKVVWSHYVNERKEFSALPSTMFNLRKAKDWNLANYWLGSKAAPKASAILELIDKVHKSQNELAEIDKEMLGSEMQEMKFIMLVGTILSLIVGVSIAVFISRMIVVRLKEVVQRTRNIAAGDLAGENIKVMGSDEITELTIAINDMSSNLKQVIGKISGSAHHLGVSSEELSAITEQTSQSVYEQQSQTEQVATAMNEMSATVQEVSKNISGTAEAANQAFIETDSGRQVVETAVQSVKQLAAQLESAADVIHELEQDSEEINKVLDVIKSIAEQTNLLALNAAIEAARAGEQGRGFAVVADEVRTLAGRTQVSTEEIQQVIEKLQSGSRKAVEVMTKSREDARSVVEQATQAGNSLSAISTAVERINDMSTQIASAAEEQSATTEEINRNIVSISEMANETSAGAQQTAVASEELAKLGTELQGMVSEFKT